MSTSSENSSPSLPENLDTCVNLASWDLLIDAVDACDREEFSDWLDDELLEMERELAKFASPGSKSPRGR